MTLQTANERWRVQCLLHGKLVNTWKPASTIGQETASSAAYGDRIAKITKLLVICSQGNIVSLPFTSVRLQVRRAREKQYQTVSFFEVG